MILIIDNYDSFTYNLYQYIGSINSDIIIKRNDKVTIKEIENLSPTHIVISPGAKTPKDAGISIDAIKHFADKIPILGVCLGHQAIIEAFGGRIIRADEIIHGKSSPINLDNDSILFNNLPKRMNVARYHSLIGDRSGFPDCLKITAWDDKNVIMAVEHKQFKVFGLQFHPESILTENGTQFIKNFLAL